MLIRWSDLANQRHNNGSIFDELQRDMEHLFHHLNPTQHKSHLIKATQYPLINLLDQGENLLLVAEVPGVKKENLELQTNAEGLTLKGKRESDIPEGASVYRNERKTFAFERHLPWPAPIDLESIEANLKDGVLQIKVAKAPEAKPRAIEIKAL